MRRSISSPPAGSRRQKAEGSRQEAGRLPELPKHGLLPTAFCLLLTAFCLLASPAGAVSVATDNGVRIPESLGALLDRARPDESFDVVVGFRVPLDQVDLTLLQVQLGAFSAVR